MLRSCCCWSPWGNYRRLEAAPNPAALVRAAWCAAFRRPPGGCTRARAHRQPGLARPARRTPVARHGNQDPGAEPAPEDRDGPSDPAHVCSARFRRRNALRRGELAQPANRLQDRPLSAKPTAGGKISASRCATPKVRLSGRPSTSSATPHRFSTTRVCRVSPVTKTRFSRSPKA